MQGTHLYRLSPGSVTIDAGYGFQALIVDSK